MRGRVRDVMTVQVTTAARTMPFKRIAELLRQHDVSALPVVDHDGRVLGIVSEADLLRPHRHEPGVRLVAVDLMTTPAVTVAPDVTVAEAARLMERNAVKRLPVVGDGGILVGIVSRSDLLRAFTRPDREIRQDVVERIVEATLIAEPYGVDVSVSDGIVRLKGRVARASERRLAAHLAGGAAGVLAVENHLEPELDDTPPAPMAAGRRHAG